MICTECGLDDKHRLDCTFAKRELKRSKRPPVANYSGLAGNRGPETMRGVVVPLMPVIEALCGICPFREVDE